MADCSCDYCNKTEDCKYAYQELSCEKERIDKMSSITAEDLKVITISFKKILNTLEKYGLEDEDFYRMTKNAVREITEWF